jgi:hypothetical protein
MLYVVKYVDLSTGYPIEHKIARVSLDRLKTDLREIIIQTPSYVKEFYTQEFLDHSLLGELVPGSSVG